MKNKKNKKKPIVSTAMKSLRKAREVTSAFHELTTAVQKAQKSGDKKQVAEAQANLDSLGGREAYQEASVLATSRSKHTSKWVFSQLTQLGLRPGKGEPPLRVLEVGAVNCQLLSVPWLSVRAIDLRSCHPKIEQADFFDLQPAGNYDAVVCSMVINCVTTAEARGDMLLRLLRHTRPGGHVFLTLPLRCLTHSPATSWAMFLSVLRRTGFVIAASKTSPKVAFFCLRNPVEEGEVDGEAQEGACCEEPNRAAPGKRKNTFAVRLAASHPEAKATAAAAGTREKRTRPQQGGSGASEAAAQAPRAPAQKVRRR